MTDLLSERCGDLLTGSYDCPDRIVLNAYYQMGQGYCQMLCIWQ